MAPARRGLPVRPRRLQRRPRLRPAAAHHRGARRGPRHRRQPRVLPRDPAVVLRRRRRPAEGARPRRAAPKAPGAGSSWRSRSATTSSRPGSSTTILGQVFESGSIFRIDHYLGKETVQNILAMRFANNLFEPIWNANYVDHVQITMAEDVGIGGRAGYYDGVGAARDVIQNHLMQLMALVAMEEPVSFDAESLRIEKLKVLSSVVLPRRLDLTTARGQYAERLGRWGEGRSASARRRASADLHHRDLRRGDAARGHPALGGRPVLPAHRQAARAPGHRGGRRLQAGARTCRSARPRPRSSPRTRW